MTFPTPTDKLAYDKAKKGIATMRIAFLLMIAVSLALGLLISPAFYFFIILFAISYLAVIPREKRKLKRSFCPHCNAHFDYSKDIEATEVTRSYTSSTQSAKGVSTVRFTCTCPNCAHSHSFTKRITVARADFNGKVDFYNLSHISKNMFV